jgi:hypothetical protein
MLAVVVALTTFAGCGDSGRAIRPRLERGPEIFSDQSESPAPLVPHIVAPKDTDPAIDKALDNHLAWLDTSAERNHKLLVFMPGHGAQPEMYQLVQKEAARLGYHVIGLMYVNGGPRLAIACGIAADPNACWEDTHLENLDGIHRNRSVVNVNVPNSIYNRLRKLLAYLAAHYPEEDWSRFLAHGEPKWSRIAVGGHSQGGAQAATIAKLHTVARAVLFSSPPDAVHTEAPLWVATHVTPTARYWGLVHDRDPGFRSIRGSWDLIGMGAFGAAVAPETSEPPYGFTHMLVTDVVPQGGSFSAGAHSAPVGDDFTPLKADGTPLLRDAWRYLLGAQDGDDDEGEDESGDEHALGPFSDWSAPVNLGPVVNSRFDDHHPGISANGLSLYITSTRPGGSGIGTENIWVSQRESLHAPWGPPRNLGPVVNVPGSNTGVPNLSPDGHRMFFNSNRPGGFGLGDLYVSYRDDTEDDFAWQSAVNLGPKINDRRYEQCAPTYFEDEERGVTSLYFCSFNRPPPDGLGDYDIFVSTLGPDGMFGPGALVRELSSPFRDTRTALRSDGLEMFITSNRPGSIGKLDIWVSTRKTTSDPWSTPIDVGPVVNAKGVRQGAPALSADGTTMYFYSDSRPDGLGGRDLYVTTRTTLKD